VHADQHGPLDLEGPLEDWRDLIGCADHEASRSECPCVLHRVHRSEGDFGLAAVFLEFLTIRDVVGAVDPDQMPVSGDSLTSIGFSMSALSPSRSSRTIGRFAVLGGLRANRTLPAYPSLAVRARKGSRPIIHNRGIELRLSVPVRRITLQIALDQY
jgi:hypothetical protein